MLTTAARQWFDDRGRRVLVGRLGTPCCPGTPACGSGPVLLDPENTLDHMPEALDRSALLSSGTTRGGFMPAPAWP